MTLESAHLDHLMHYLDLHAEPVSADLAFVFGTRLPQPAELVAQLHQTGLVPLIVLTGGRNRLTNQIEAHDHRDMLTAAGVPLEHIIVEDQSTNTLENVRFALPLLAARRDLTTIGRILVIAKWYHARRAMMTLKRHLPNGIRYFPITYKPAGISRSNWHTSAEGRQHILGNWHAIPTYLAQGHLAEISPEGNAFI